VQLSGNQYRMNSEIGLHYQLHRGIGFHHAAAIAKGVPFRVNVLVGGPPSLAVAAVMPLPDNFPEVAFAGALSQRAVRMVRMPGRPMIAAECDFCISGTVDPSRLLPEGPFGDHLGYYSLAHDFPGHARGRRIPPQRRRLAFHCRGAAAAGGHHLWGIDS
jgi:4-hydroxy-3-polyprenylbenzoate decarboxylase